MQKNARPLGYPAIDYSRGGSGGMRQRATGRPPSPEPNAALTVISPSPSRRMTAVARPPKRRCPAASVNGTCSQASPLPTPRILPGPSTENATASVAALENTTLLKITRDDLEEYFTKNPDKILRVMKQMAERLRDLTDDYMEACRTISEMDRCDADADEEEQIPGLVERIARFTAIFKKHK